MNNTYEITMPKKFLSSEFFAKQNEGCQLFTIDGKLYISGCDSQAEADAAIAAHNPPAPTESTVEEKLASVGLNLNDLKTALGL